jgi:DeoR/GlpR family transcriptional regulator of sugar metabolism
MFASDRQALIVAAVEADGRVVSIDVAERLGVSMDTVRRDLAELETQGVLRRVHGGAVRPVPGPRRFTERLGNDDDTAKRTLARLAAETLPRDGLVAIAGGTSALLVARSLARDFSGVVVTSSPDVALALRDHDVDLLGGRLHRDSQTVTGAATVKQLERLRPDACVVGSCGVDAQVGVTFREREEADVVRAMIERSARAIVLATRDKLGASSPYVAAPAGRIDVLVTDGPAEAFAALGVAVVRP